MKRFDRRRGATLVLVLVTLGVALLLCGGLLQLALRQRRLVERQHREAQAAWLVEAGIERAAARLAADPAYEGETWTIPAEQLPTGEPAEVRIAVLPSVDGAEQRTIEVAADFPAGTELRSRRSKHIVWTAPDAGEGT